MAEKQPPSYLQTSTNNDAITDRRTFQALAFEGVAGFNTAGDLLVIPNAPAGMSVIVQRGGAFVQGDDTQDQGLYFVYNDADKVVTITAADASLDRTDLIVARIRDATVGVPGDTWAIEVVQGALGGGVPALPASALSLAQVSVPHGTSSINAAKLTDTRKKLSTSLQQGAEVVSLYLSSAQGVADDGNEHKVLLSTVGLDPYGYANTGTHRIVIPAGHAGTFRFGGQVQFQSALSGQRRAVIYQNTSNQIALSLVQANTTGVGVPMTVPVISPPVKASDGDIFELFAMQTNGSTINVNAGSGVTFLWAERLGA